MNNPKLYSVTVNTEDESIPIIEIRQNNSIIEMPVMDAKELANEILKEVKEFE